MRKKNLLIILFWIIGALIFLTPSIYSWYSSNKEAHSLIEYKRQIKTDSKQITAARIFNQYVKNNQGKVPTKRYFEEAKKAGINAGEVIGYLEIPAIKLKNKPILFGDSYENLSKGLGTLTFTSLPIGGDNILAGITGHSGVANQVFFDNIKFLKKGDLIKTYVLGEEYTYQVTHKKIIDPKKRFADRAFFIKENQNQIALMTCTPIFINSKRLIVYAKRIPNKQINNKAVQYRAFWSIENIYMIFVGIILIMILVAIYYRNYQLKRRHHANKTTTD